MDYLMIHTSSIENLKKGELENVTIKCKNRLLLRDKEWKIPRVYLIRYYQEDCGGGGILLDVIRNNQRYRIGSVTARYLRFPFKNTHLTKETFHTILEFETAIAQLKKMSSYGVTFDKYADFLDDIFMDGDVNNDGDTPWETRWSFAQEPKLGICLRPVRKYEEEELSIFYFVDARSKPPLYSECSVPDPIPVDSQTIAGYVAARENLRYLYTDDLPTPIYDFLMQPKTVELFSAMYRCIEELGLFKIN